METDIFEKLELHEQRVVTERDELLDKVSKLEKFLGGEVASSLGEVDLFLLRSQLVWMRSYLDILERRIELFTSRLDGGDGVSDSSGYYTSGENLIGQFGIGNDSVFTLKLVASRYIDMVEKLGSSYRRKSLAVDDMERSCMMAVKSLF